MRVVRLPYLQSATPATLTSWVLHSDGVPSPMPEVHPAWDSALNVHVSRTIEFDGDRFMRETGVGMGARIRLVAGFECQHARSRSFPWRRNVALPSGFAGSIEVKAPASRLAVGIELVVGAILLGAGTGGSRVAARIPGSWLWVERVHLGLDGSRGRFPMEWIAFKKSGLPPQAAWLLDWPAQDWNAPALGAMRLLLNSDNAVIRRVVDLPEQDARRRIVLRSARFDVAKQLVIAALTSDEFFELSSQFTEGSVGYSVRLLINGIFPNEEHRTLRERMIHHAGEFHAQLQDGLGAFNVELDD